jgi:hypothetical protein
LWNSLYFFFGISVSYSLPVTSWWEWKGGRLGYKVSKQDEVPFLIFTLLVIPFVIISLFAWLHYSLAPHLARYHINFVPMLVSPFWFCFTIIEGGMKNKRNLIHACLFNNKNKHVLMTLVSYVCLKVLILVVLNHISWWIDLITLFEKTCSKEWILCSVWVEYQICAFTFSNKKFTYPTKFSKLYPCPWD